MNFTRVADNTFLINQEGQFAAGSLTDLTLHRHQGQVELTLAKTDDSYETQGVFQSDAFQTPDFSQLLLSWNGQTPQSTYLELQARVKVGDQWSAWLSWGKWGTTIASASVTNDADPLAFVDTDTLIVRHDARADRVQIRVILHSDHTALTPTLQLICFSVLTDAQKHDHESGMPLNKDIPTPAYAQLVRDPKLAPNICSPTTITMAMNRMGGNLLVEETAYQDYDYVYQGFGNWAFNMALAGSYGFQAYAEFTEIDGLKKEIAAGYPVGVSVQYTNDPNDKTLPYLENAYGPTHGHLLLVRGFQTIDDTEYVLVNDPFTASNQQAAKRYRLSQFQNAWSTHMAYIIHENKPAVIADRTKRQQAFLRPTDEKNTFALYLGQHRLAFPADFADASDPLKIKSGSLAYSLTADPEDQDLAGQHFYYTHATKSGNVYLDLSEIKKQTAGKKSRLTLYVMAALDKTYIAEMPII